MKDYKKLLNAINDIEVSLCLHSVANLPNKLNALCDCQDLVTKIEQGELVSVKAVAKLLNNTFECPCGYIFKDEDVAEFMFKHYEGWCEENCAKNTEDNTPCWEMYLKAKLKELNGEV